MRSFLSEKVKLKYEVFGIETLEELLYVSNFVSYSR